MVLTRGGLINLMGYVLLTVMCDVMMVEQWTYVADCVNRRAGFLT